MTSAIAFIMSFTYEELQAVHDAAYTEYDEHGGSELGYERVWKQEMEKILNSREGL